MNQKKNTGNVTESKECYGSFHVFAILLGAMFKDKISLRHVKITNILIFGAPKLNCHNKFLLLLI